jgi:hypothetical protein
MLKWTSYHMQTTNTSRTAESRRHGVSIYISSSSVHYHNNTARSGYQFSPISYIGHLFYVQIHIFMSTFSVHSHADFFARVPHRQQHVNLSRSGAVSSPSSVVRVFVASHLRTLQAVVQLKYNNFY